MRTNLWGLLISSTVWQASTHPNRNVYAGIYLIVALIMLLISFISTRKEKKG